MPEAAQDLAQKALTSTLDFKIGKVDISLTYIQAAAIAFLIFLLIYTLARLRKIYIKWSFKGWHAWLFMGFLLALILEGFLLIGGRTVLTGLLGWKNPPEPVQNALDAGRTKLVDVLGETGEVPESTARENLTSDEVIASFQSLPPDEAQKVSSLICQP